MEEMIFFDSAKDNVTRFFDREFPDFPPLVMSHFLNGFNEILNWSEEGETIRPKLVFTNNIEAVVKAIPKSNAMTVFEDKDASNYNKRLKSLLAITKPDWLVFVEIKEKGITYGLLMSFSSIKDRNLLRALEENVSLKDKQPKVFCIVARPLNVYTMQLHSVSGEKLTVNFSLDKTKFSQYTTEIKNFVDASFSKLRTTPRKLQDMKNMYLNIFSTVMNDVHGTICVVVDKDYVDTGLFEDGIWLKEPISFSKLFTQSKSYSETKLRVYSDLFIRMVNFDGITVLDNKGRILAYNVFVETNNKKLGYIVGGARKRAAYYILNSKRKGIVGVFFLSHEGEVFYRELKPRENKSVIKLETAKEPVKEAVTIKDEPKKEVPKLETKQEFKENVERIAEIIEEKIDENTNQLSFAFVEETKPKT